MSQTIALLVGGVLCNVIANKQVFVCSAIPQVPCSIPAPWPRKLACDWPLSQFLLFGALLLFPRDIDPVINTDAGLVVTPSTAEPASLLTCPADPPTAVP